jgi:hypothetical protein
MIRVAIVAALAAAFVVSVSVPVQAQGRNSILPPSTAKAYGYCDGMPDEETCKREHPESVPPVQVQNLPGPANSVWYVLMGEVQASGLRQRLCGAAIVPETELGSALASISYKRGIQFAPSKRFGPYPNKQAAQSALRQAGWEDKGESKGEFSQWLATAGCF